MNCRHCKSELDMAFLDLGSAPPSNAYLTEEGLKRPETWFPLRVMVCESCWLVQTEDYAESFDLFTDDYAYFSSTSKSWLQHAADYTSHVINLLNLNSESYVIEVASNDGYLLKNFLDAGIPCLGIEPTASTAEAAERIGIPVLREFFGADFAQHFVSQNRQADLIIGNNVYAHVPDINDFTMGLKKALKTGGTITLEFPHVLRLIENHQFDTIYHEHYSYLSLYTVNRIFREHGLRIWRVEELPTHGGSLRVYGCHADDSRLEQPSVELLLEEERKRGLQTRLPYEGFQECAERIKDDLLAFLIEQKRSGKRVAAYGAAAKGNTLLNFAGIRPDLLPLVYDAAPAKQFQYMPGSRIPILPNSYLEKDPPDFLLILPWNISDEICKQNESLKSRGTRFVTAIPELRVL